MMKKIAILLSFILSTGISVAQVSIENFTGTTITVTASIRSQNPHIPPRSNTKVITARYDTISYPNIPYPLDRIIAATDGRSPCHITNPRRKVRIVYDQYNNGKFTCFTL